MLTAVATATMHEMPRVFLITLICYAYELLDYVWRKAFSLSML